MNDVTRTTRFPLPTALPTACLVLLLAGCGDSGTSATEPSKNGDTNVPAITAPPTTDTGAGNGGSAPVEPGVPPAPPPVGERSRTSDCDAAILSAALPGSSVEEATPFVAGEFVSGTVRLGDVDYWRVTVDTGQRYRVVLDTRRVGADASRTGLIYRSSLDGGTTWTRGIASEDRDGRLREVRILSVFGTAASGEMFVSIESRFGPESHQLAVVEQDERVPAPYAVDCPSVASLAVGTSEAFDLGGPGSDAEDRWFALEMPAEGALALSLATSSIGPPQEATIDYGFRLFGEFGQLQSSTLDDIVRLDTGSNVSHTATVPLVREGRTAGEGDVIFLRFRNYGPPLLIEASSVSTP